MIQHMNTIRATYYSKPVQQICIVFNSLKQIFLHIVLPARLYPTAFKTPTIFNLKHEVMVISGTNTVLRRRRVKLCIALMKGNLSTNNTSQGRVGTNRPLQRCTVDDIIQDLPTTFLTRMLRIPRNAFLNLSRKHCDINDETLPHPEEYLNLFVTLIWL